jgi:hypothetical protein
MIACAGLLVSCILARNRRAPMSIVGTLSVEQSSHQKNDRLGRVLIIRHVYYSAASGNQKTTAPCDKWTHTVHAWRSRSSLLTTTGKHPFSPAIPRCWWHRALNDQADAAIKSQRHPNRYAGALANARAPPRLHLLTRQAHWLMLLGAVRVLRELKKSPPGFLAGRF